MNGNDGGNIPTEEKESVDPSSQLSSSSGPSQPDLLPIIVAFVKLVSKVIKIQSIVATANVIRITQMIAFTV